MEYAFYYSNRCPHCEKFYKLLSEYPMLNEKVQKICIDQVRAPPQLQYLPGILDKNQLFMANEAFKWLQEKTKENFSSSGTQSGISGDHGLEFSFIAGTENNYDTKSAVWGQENINNGSAVDPNKFDPRSGQPTNTQYNVQHINNTPIATMQQNNPTQYNPTQYNPTQYNPTQNNPTQYNPTQNNPTQYNPTQYNPTEYNPSGQQSGQTELPPQLRSEKVSSGNKLNDHEMQRMLQERNNSFPTIQRR